MAMFNSYVSHYQRVIINQHSALKALSGHSRGHRGFALSLSSDHPPEG